MNEITLPAQLTVQLTELYAEMENRYAEVAAELQFSCTGCPDNCCDSYFQHHTYIEWAYLWTGLKNLPGAELDESMARAASYIKQSEFMLSRGKLPDIMCPLNRQGLCALYSHRLMICRLHGVPATLSRPDGKVLRFPGCFRCQDLLEQKQGAGNNLPMLERVDLYQRLAELEMRLLGGRRQAVPKVKLTIAQMLIQGPPQLA
jgi:Fe-S-cluster containining protein